MNQDSKTKKPKRPAGGTKKNAPRKVYGADMRYIVTRCSQPVLIEDEFDDSPTPPRQPTLTVYH